MNLKDLLFPKFCAGCGALGDYVCQRCRAKLRAKIRRRMAWIFDLPVHFLFDYQVDLVAKIVHLFKYGQVAEINELLAEFMGRLDEILPAKCLLVPAPISAERLRERGFNQAELLAEALARDGRRVRCLLTRMNARAQAELGRAQRLENLKGKFSCETVDFEDQTVVLIDDVCTTGATLRECESALRAAGAKKILAVVVAKG